ncbi:hypothetical protein LTS18_003136, partial [Coniosporium uncinatum]
MALVDYPSSSDDESDNEPTVSHQSTPPSQPSAAKSSRSVLTKRKRTANNDDKDDENATTTSQKQKRSDSPPPPLPPAFHDLYTTTPRTFDDPTFHGGRKRQTPHVEGNWPSHVYLMWFPTPTQTEVLTNLLSTLTALSAAKLACNRWAAEEDAAGAKLHTLVTSDTGTSLPLHISLSRPLTLHTTTKAAFLSTLQTRIHGSSVRPFEARFTGLRWEANATRTRWFLVLGVEKITGGGSDVRGGVVGGGDELNKLLRTCNQVCAEMGLGGLYGDGEQEIRAREKRERLEKRREVAEMRVRGKVRVDWGMGPRRTHDGDGDGEGKAGVEDKTKRQSEVKKDSQPDKKKEEVEIMAREADRSECFHVSLAWRLTAPEDDDEDSVIMGGKEVPGGRRDDGDGVKLAEPMEEVRNMRVSFDAVKVKIG